MEKLYIRGNTEKMITSCKNCYKQIVKNDPKQVVYFCSRSCRLEFKRRDDEAFSDIAEY